MNLLPFAEQYPIKVARGGQPAVLRGSGALPGTTKIVIDCTGIGNILTSFQAYSANLIAPHITLDPKTMKVYQHIDLDQAAPVDEYSKQAPHKRGQVIWVNVAKMPSDHLPDSEVQWVGKVVAQIAAHLEDIDTKSVTDFPGVVNSGDKSVLMALGSWYNFSGIASAGVVPFVFRFGPGRFDRDVFMSGLHYKAKAPEDWPTFKGRPFSLGSKGKRVEAIQKAADYKVTGEFDEEIDRLVRRVQTFNGLEVTGEVDSNTWNALGEFLVG